MFVDVSKISRSIFSLSKPLRKANWTIIVLCFSTAATFWFFNALNKVYTTRIDYPIELVYNKDSLVLVQEPPREISINVTGGGWQLFKRTISLDSDPVFLQPENPTQTQYFTAGNLLPIFSNQLTDLNINYIATDTVFFDIETYLDRILAIDLDSTSINLKENFYITSEISIEPDTIIFHGPESLVRKLPEIFTVSLPEKNIDDRYNEEISLDLFSPSIIKKEPEVINILFDVEEFVNQSLPVDIEMVNFPHDSTIYIQKSQVDISFLLQKSFRNKLESGDFLIIADLKYMHAVDSTITLEIMDQPDYVKFVELSENRVKVIYAK